MCELRKMKNISCVRQLKIKSHKKGVFEANDMVYKDWAFFPFDYKENTYNSLDSYVSQVIEKVAEKNNFTVQEFDLPW